MKVVIAAGAGGLERRLAAHRDHARPRHPGVSTVLRSVAFLPRRTDLAGIVNLTAPEPIRSRDMMASLRQALNRP